jgi:uncharacterized phage protein gp47/JayE
MLTGIMANQSRQVWECLNGLYHSLRPDEATGRALEALCSLTGTYRKKATYSRATANLTLDAKTTVPAGSIIKTINGHTFKTTTEIKNDTNGETQREVDLIAEAQGPLYAHPNTVATIMTPIAGWSSAIIVKTYETGTYDETDHELRKRRIEELRASGAATLDAMYALLKEVKGVEALFIKEDEHAFEVVIKGGNAQEIAQTIWDCKPLGVKSEGSISQRVKDVLEQERIIRFSRPTEIPLKLTIQLKVLKELDKDALKLSLVEFARIHFKLGTDVYPSRFLSVILADENVLDVLELKFPEAPTHIKENEIASLGFNDIEIKQVT